MKKLLLYFFILWGSYAFSQLYQVPVYTATSLQPAQPGNEVSNMLDGNSTTMYHSKWYQNGIPDELTFYFTSTVTSIKKLVYTPRQSGGMNGIWTNVSISYSTQAAPNTFTQVNNNIIWASNAQDKEIIFPTAIQNPYIIKISVNSGVGDFSSCAEMKFYSETQPLLADGTDCTINTSELSVNGANDVKAVILPSGTTASSYQPGENIDKSYDNDVNTLYHSSYGNTTFPVVLNYRLDGVTPIDYLKYTPRMSGDNGKFGNVSISYNTTSNNTFVPLMSFDFQNSSAPVKVYFPNQITPLNVRITVNNGMGNFASCAEMGFYKVGSSGNANNYAHIFANNLYSALQPSVTQEDINAITSPFYKALAQCLFNGTYVKKYRIQDYKVYPPVSITTSNLKVGSGYNNFENPTGIAFAKEDKVAMFVQGIPSGVNVFLQVKDFSTSINETTSYYQLNNGLNVLQLTNSGLGYFSYYNTNSTLPDIKVNIVSGKVNGFYHYQTSTQSDWPANLANSAYNMIDVVGQHSHLVYKKSMLRNFVPLDPSELISKYDLIVKNEWLVMGLYKYNLIPKNRMFSYSNNGGGWYAGNLGINMDSDWGEENMVKVNKLSLWGLAHEFGHINQIRPDVKWIGTTEVTNNMHSAWVDYNMNPENDGMSRLERESVTPATGMSSISGGRINGAILNTTINQEALQGNANTDVFKVLVPFWQLELYYQLAGASRNAPTLSFNYPTNYTGIDYAHWFGMVANIARSYNASGVSNGELLLNFVKNTCIVVQEDLTDFFIKTGFLRPINKTIDDYGIGQLTITQAQIDSTIEYIKAQKYQKPVSPVMHYISSRSIEAFRDHLPLSGQTGQGVNLNNNYLTVQHSIWQNAVAYETLDANNKLIYVSVKGTGDITNQTTKVYYPSNAAAVYAIGYDGQRILVYPSLSSSLRTAAKEMIQDDSQPMVYPNPVDGNSSIHIKIKNASGNYSAMLSAMDGKIILSLTGDLDAIEKKINKEIPTCPSGTYLLNLTDAKGNTFNSVKITKK